MASNPSLLLDYEEHAFAARWASSLLVGALVFLTVVMIVAAVWPESRASEAAWKRHVVANCRTPECISPLQVLTPKRAGWMKREMGGLAMVVDIATPGEPARDAWRVPIDAYVPFMEPGAVPGANPVADSPEMVFRHDFCARMDEAMRSAHLAYDRPVILVSPSMERSLLAALLLQEHGFTNILVMNS